MNKLSEAARKVDSLSLRFDTFSKRTDAGKHGVYFGARKLQGDNFGIHIKLYRNGDLETEDLNTTPWPNEKVALERSERSARGWAEKEGVPFKGRM